MFLDNRQDESARVDNFKIPTWHLQHDSCLPWHGGDKARTPLHPANALVKRVGLPVEQAAQVWKETFYLTTHSTHFIYSYMTLEGRKEMVYLTTHSTHFIYGYMTLEGRKEMFYLTMHSTHFIYGVKHMVKDHSDSEKGNPLPPHRLLLSINSKGSFICIIPQTVGHIPWPLLHQSWSTG